MITLSIPHNKLSWIPDSVLSFLELDCSSHHPLPLAWGIVETVLLCLLQNKTYPVKPFLSKI